MLKKCVGSKNDMCAPSRHQKPKNMRHKPNFEKKFCKDIISKGWKSLAHGFPVRRTDGSKRSNQCFPILEPGVPTSRNCWFPNVRINASQSWNHRFRVQRADGFKYWNHCVGIFEPRVASSKVGFFWLFVVLTLTRRRKHCGSLVRVYSRN